MKKRIQNFFSYEGFILIGILMVMGTAVKLSGFYDFSSDWFWLLAGIGLVVEGTVAMIKQKKFDKKIQDY
ncbi:MAG: hypothetical protein ABH864_06140 [archaeon]